MFVWRRLRTRIVWVGTRIAIIWTAREGKEISNIVWLAWKQGSVTSSIISLRGSKEILPILVPVRVVEDGPAQLANLRKSAMPGSHEVGVRESKSTKTKHDTENSNATTTTGGRSLMATAALGETNASLSRIHDDDQSPYQRKKNLKYDRKE